MCVYSVYSVCVRVCSAAIYVCGLSDSVDLIDSGKHHFELYVILVQVRLRVVGLYIAACVTNFCCKVESFVT